MRYREMGSNGIKVSEVGFGTAATSGLMTKNHEIDGTRFPNFKKLEGESTWYPNETTTSYFTPTS